MPGEIIGELLIRPIAELILHIVGYYTSRILLPIFSFGHIFVAPHPKESKLNLNGMDLDPHLMGK